MNVDIQIAAHFGTQPELIEIDPDSGYAGSCHGEPCNVWLVRVRGTWHDVWTNTRGNVRLACVA